jgi:hypothetical protein
MFSVQSNATMENHALVEAIDHITEIKLPTVVKVDEIQRGRVSMALKKFDWKTKNIEVIIYLLAIINRIMYIKYKLLSIVCVKVYIQRFINNHCDG